MVISVTWLVNMRDMTHLYVWHHSSICVTWLFHMCDMTHPYVWHDLSNSVKPYTVIHHVWLLVWHISSICATWLYVCLIHSVTRLIHACVGTPAYAWHDSSTPMTWLCQDSWRLTPPSNTYGNSFDTSWLYAWHVSSICVSWLLYARDMTYEVALVSRID